MSDIKEMKGNLRKEIKGRLRVLDAESLRRGSHGVAAKLTQLGIWDSAQGVSVYLSMPIMELQTQPIIAELFKAGKRVYVPKIMGGKSADMKMVQILNLEEVEAFPQTKWKIPEPPLELLEERAEGVANGDIDLVIAPGLGFDASCQRLGHGMGYYDSFFERCFASRVRHGKPRPTVVGVGLDEQVVESIPIESHDVALCAIVTPSYHFQNGASSS
ncbi:unnamed protein product [Chrysoparadoxa australica]